MIRILIINNQNSVLENLQVLLESEAEFEVVGTAPNCQTGIESIAQLQPDIAIVDPVTSEGEAIDVYAISQQVQTKIIVYTESPQQLNRAILAGAKGYLLDDSSIIDLKGAIYAVRRDNIYIGRGILDRVRLSSVDSQKSQVRNINMWLAKEILHLLRDLLPVRDSVADEMMDNLNFSRAGLMQMKQHLYHQDKDTTLTADAVSAIEELFTRIAKSDNLKQRLKEDKQLILNFLGKNSVDNRAYISTIKDNFEFLNGVTSKNVSKAIYTISRQASPLPLLAFFQSTQKYLLDWQKYFERESQNNLENRKSALVSFERVWQSINKPIQKLDICRKAAILALQSQIEAETCRFMAEMVAGAIAQFEMQIDILNQTNSFLLEAIAELEPESQIDAVVLNLYLERLQTKTSIEKLQHSLETAIGQPLSQWGVNTIGCTKITELLLRELDSITPQLYADLRQEALAISFLEYADKYYEEKDINS